MYILDRYGVEYKSISSAKKDSAYKKVPVLLIGGKQINDSEIIATILAKVLDGVEYTKFEQEIEKLTTRELMVACEVFVMDSTPELQRCGCAMGGCIGSMLCCLACCIPCFGVSKGPRAKFPDLRPVSVIAKDYAERLGDKKYFHGDTCGVIDCSIFGTLSPFEKSKSATFRDFMSVDRLREWHDRMTSSFVKKVPNHST
jgi:Glutathione S-transferase, C-terminal domain